LKYLLPWLLLLRSCDYAPAASVFWEASAPEDGVTEYMVNTGILPGALYESLFTTNTELEVSSVLADGLQHFFNVVAVNALGQSAPSNVLVWTPWPDLTVTIVIESTTPATSWSYDREFSFTVPRADPARFFRARFKIQ